MAFNSFGNILKLTTYGESHGSAIGGIIDGFPAGLLINLDAIQEELNRRKPGQSNIVTQRKEPDTVEFLSGIFEGKTTGTSIGFIIKNTNQKSHDYSHNTNVYRPSHADFTYDKKFGIRDYRGGGRSSARETANWVVAGALAKQLISSISINAYTSSVGNIEMNKAYDQLDFSKTESNIVRCPDENMAALMINKIKEIEKNDFVTIGNHTVNHYALNKLTEEKVIEELTESSKIIQEKTGKPVSVKIGRYGPLAQIGETSEDKDAEKPQFASLRTGLNIETITLEEALELFKLPKDLGVYKGEDLIVNNGRFGPYVKFGDKFISLPKGLDPMRVEIEDAIELVKEKEAADAPIYEYDGLPVQKGKGRFGPFIKWNNMFINVNKKYDWDHLSNDDIESLIKDKIQKEIDKLIHDWEEDGIRVEKARWGRHNIIQGKTKIELPKTVDATKLTLEEVKGIIAKNAPKKKTRAKKKK